MCLRINSIYFSLRNHSLITYIYIDNEFVQILEAPQTSHILYKYRYPSTTELQRVLFFYCTKKAVNLELDSFFYIIIYYVLFVKLLTSLQRRLTCYLLNLYGNQQV